MDKTQQAYRQLVMYERLKKGEAIVKREEAVRFHTSEKTIQRDLRNISKFLELEGINTSIVYSRKRRGYVLQEEFPTWLRNEEIFVILKVLIESRALPKVEMEALIDKLTALARRDEQKRIRQMMANEKHLYVELQHQKPLVDILWQLSSAILQKKIIRINYQREQQEQPTERKLKPVGIMFSEFYFYLIAYRLESQYEYPIVYRVDRIESCIVTGISFKIPYEERFQEGEFRKRVQFMYTGELLTVQFKFTGVSPQAVLDRLPTARVLERTTAHMLVEAEVFGTGVMMWLLSQGKGVEVLKPAHFRDAFAAELAAMQQLYAPLEARN